MLSEIIKGFSLKNNKCQLSQSKFSVRPFKIPYRSKKRYPNISLSNAKNTICTFFLIKDLDWWNYWGVLSHIFNQGKPENKSQRDVCNSVLCWACRVPNNDLVLSLHSSYHFVNRYVLLPVTKLWSHFTVFLDSRLLSKYTQHKGTQS